VPPSIHFRCDNISFNIIVASNSYRRHHVGSPIIVSPIIVAHYVNSLVSRQSCRSVCLTLTGNTILKHCRAIFEEVLCKIRARFLPAQKGPNLAQKSCTENLVTERVFSRECLFVSCCPEPSFADMACRVATCRRHVFGHVADSATLHVG
jgi:hypothetical protein